ncbi:MAG: riboflavin synthase, partial [Chthoniobacterales bacterium]
MFTGLIEELGRVLANSDGRLQVSARRIAKTARVGESIALNGCCLTVASRSRDKLGFDLLQETLDRTNLKTVRRGGFVNLERALRAADRLGGHFVQGHVDCVARIRSFEKRGADYRLEIELRARFARYAIAKGSIAIDGISLTIAEVLPKSVVIWIIPYTRRHTTLD